MKTRLAAAVAATLALTAGAADAATQTLQATISNVTGGAELLAELGIASGGTLTALVSYDSDVSSGATTVSGVKWSYDRLYSTYTGFSLSGPAETIAAVASDAVNHAVITRDGLADGTADISDLFAVRSYLLSSDTTLYYRLYLDSWDYDETKWSRGSPITAVLLNSFSRKTLLFQKYVTLASGGTQFQKVSSSSVVWSPVAPVPLPATLPLMLAGLGLVALVRRRA